MTVRYRGSGLPGAAVDRNPGATGRIPADRRPETARERRAGVLWSAAWELARRLPEPVVFGMADVGGRLASRCTPEIRRRVRRNLSRIVSHPEALDAAVRSAYRSYARYWVEAFRAADLQPGDLDRRTTTGGFEHLDGVLDQGRGAVVLLAHHGSWDVAARWAETHGYHLAVVAEVVRPRRVFERFVRLREAIGLEIVPLRRGDAEQEATAAKDRLDASAGRGTVADEDRLGAPAGRGAVADQGRLGAPAGGHTMVGRLGKVLADNHLVGLLTDRDLTGRAPAVDFFGEPCRVPVGAAVLARRHGAPIVPITMLQRPGRRWHLQVLPAIDPDGRTLTELHRAAVGRLEDLILLDPSQWHAFQPIWLSDRGTGSVPDAGSGEERS